MIGATARRRTGPESLDGVEVAGLYRAAPGQPTGWSVHPSVVNAADPAGTPVVFRQPPEAGHAMTLGGAVVTEPRDN